METVIFQTSLIAAFFGGMVALFAPCCITFLLPSYLGSVFKEKERVLFMTFVFGLGIFVVLLPAVLGVSLISQLFFRYHNTTYILGGAVLLFISAISFLGIKLPVPSFAGRNIEGRTDVLSIFTLGVFSGIASACCAPVLIGILTLTFLSTNFFGALLIGAMYVLGMVVPLLLISTFLSGKMPKVAVLRQKITSVYLFGKEYPIILSNIIAGFIFFITGALTLLLTLTGRLSMGNLSGFTKMIQDAQGLANQYFAGNLLLNIVFLGIVIYLIYALSKKL